MHRWLGFKFVRCRYCKRSVVTVVQDADRLFVHIPGQGKTQMYAAPSADMFFVPGVGYFPPFTFVRDENGTPTELSFDVAEQ